MRLLTATNARSVPPRSAEPLLAAGRQSAYGLTFWLCYAANLSLTMTFSMLFRYADFVDFLGGNEMDLGLVTGVGMFGALAVRSVQGVAIDRYGPRRVWLVSLVCVAASCLVHLAIQRVDSAGIYLARILLTTGIAGSFGASLTYITLQAPPNRMGEMIGTLGTSGFIGIGLGPTLADWLCAAEQVGRAEVVRMFLWAAAFSLIALVLAWFATRKGVRITPRRRPPLLAVIRKYHPGVMLLVSLGTGLALGFPHVFVRAYAADLGISRIKLYFLVYAGVAFLVRIITRRAADERGVRPVILWGFAAAASSMLLYLGVRSELGLALPAVLAGTAHALLFPAVMAGGNAAFPLRYRGIATTLMFAMFDIGNLVGQPTVGGLVRLGYHRGWPAYPTMFVLMALFLGAIGSGYAWRSRKGAANAAGQRGEAC